MSFRAVHVHVAAAGAWAKLVSFNAMLTLHCTTRHTPRHATLCYVFICRWGELIKAAQQRSKLHASMKEHLEVELKAKVAAFKKAYYERALMGIKAAQQAQKQFDVRLLSPWWRTFVFFGCAN